MMADRAWYAAQIPLAQMAAVPIHPSSTGFRARALIRRQSTSRRGLDTWARTGAAGAICSDATGAIEGIGIAVGPGAGNVAGNGVQVCLQLAQRNSRPRSFGSGRS